MVQGVPPRSGGLRRIASERCVRNHATDRGCSAVLFIDDEASCCERLIASRPALGLISEFLCPTVSVASRIVGAFSSKLLFRRF